MNREGQNERFHSFCDNCKKLIPNGHFDCIEEDKKQSSAYQRQKFLEITEETAKDIALKIDKKDKELWPEKHIHDSTHNQTLSDFIEALKDKI